MNKINSKKRVFITGSAGFIGYHLSKKFLNEGFEVIGFDGLTHYYDVNLKKDRNQLLKEDINYTFYKGLLEDNDFLEGIIKETRPQLVIHLAAQAGVRYSIESPRSYLKSNIEGTFNLIEAIKKYGCEHLMIASTSSVYGNNKKMPFAERDKADNQISFYAATKKAVEVLSHSYSSLFNLPITCFRFFTVYGPWGRPDMALFKFTEEIIKGNEIDIYNFGDMYRDFTFIDDLTEAIFRLSYVVPEAKNESKNISLNDSLSTDTPWRVVNIGNAEPKKLEYFIRALEDSLGLKAKKNYLPMQKGDVKKTEADITLLKELISFEPKTSIAKGIEEFVSWYKNYYKLNRNGGD